MEEGTIIRGIGGLYTVEDASGALIPCRAKGTFRREKRTPLTGDNVRFLPRSEDGSGFITDILPRTNALIRPAVATAMVLVFQQAWTNLETSSYFTNDESMKTLTFYMNTLVSASGGVAGQGVAAAASLIMFVPNLILFIICQNAVMNTMATSGIK